VNFRSSLTLARGAWAPNPTGRKLTWDSFRERFTGEFARQGNAYVRREMRAPYDYTFVS